MFCEIFILRKPLPYRLRHLLTVDVAELISVIDCLDEKFIRRIITVTGFHEFFCDRFWSYGINAIHLVKKGLDCFPQEFYCELKFLYLSRLDVVGNELLK